MPDEWRIYRLVKLTGWTLAEIDAAPAEMCDWLLRLETLEAQVRAAARRKAER